MVRICCGRQGSGKTSQILQSIAALAGTERIFLCVPEQFTYEAERMLFDVLDTNGIMHVQVVSLQRLATIICGKTPLKDRTILTREGKGLIVKRIVDENESELRLFRGVSDKTGFLDRVMAFVGELKENAISAELLERVAERETDGTLKEKLSDIGMIYRRYEEILSRDYIDPQDYLSECAQYALNDPELKGSRFFFDGFHTFDRSAYPLIEAVMAVSASCEIGLTFDTDAFFSVSADTLRQLQDCAERANRACELIAMGNKHTQTEAISYLEAHFSDAEACAYRQPSNGIALMRCTTKENEIACAAAEILRLVREEGYRFSDIALIVPDLDGYAEMIDDAFTQKEIACFIDRRKPIIFSSPVRAFLFLVSMTDRKMSGTELIAFAKTGFSDISDEECMIIENYALECGIKGSMWEKEFTRNNAGDGYDLFCLNEIREKLVQPVLAVREAVKGVPDMRQYCEQLNNALTACGFREKISACSERFASSGDYETANTYAQIYNKLLSVLEQTYDFFGDESLSPQEFHDMLAYALTGASVGIIPSTIDKVTVGDVRRSRAGNVKVMFVLGANEGMLPADTSDQGILSDDEKEAVRVKGLDLIQSADYNRAKEEFLIYTLLSKPSEQLYVSRFATDQDGESYAASSVYERIEELFPNCRILTDEPTDADEELHMISDRHGALTHLSANLSARAAQEERDPRFDLLYDDIFRYFSETQAAKLELIRRGLLFDNSAVIEDSALYSKAMPLPVSLSVSRLEKYTACPFSFFAEYLLRPTPRKEHAVKNTDIGSVLHKTVELYSRRILDRTVDPQSVTPQEISRISRAITEQVIAEYSAGLFAQISKSPYLRTKLMRASEAAISEITRQLNRSDFMLTESEAKFRFDGTYQPICADIEGYGKVYLQGVIDRIDTYEKNGSRYVKVIDYKTGARDFDLTKAYYGLSLQLPVYITAATAQDEASRAAGVFYFRIKPPMVKIKKESSDDDIAKQIRKDFALRGITVRDMEIIKAMDNEAEHESFLANVTLNKNGTLRESDSLIDPAVFDSLLKRTKQNIETAAKEMLSGQIGITPYRYGKNEIPCTYCKHKGLCKFSESFGANCYREIRKKKAAELYAKMQETEGEL